MSHFRPPPDPATLERDDPLSRMTAVTLARELTALSWEDAEKLRSNEITEKIAGQLYASLGSILANLAEGYSRSSGKERARIFEYALGSVRESMMWYRMTTRVLGQELVDDRLVTLEQIRRLLLAIIPRERGKLIRPKTGK